jgi:hypothetical protein
MGKRKASARMVAEKKCVKITRNGRKDLEAH